MEKKLNLSGWVGCDFEGRGGKEWAYIKYTIQVMQLARCERMEVLAKAA